VDITISYSLINKSILATDNEGAINAYYFLKPAFDRYKKTKDNEMRLHDTVVFSNVICSRVRDKSVPLRLLGPLKEYVVGLVADYLDYRFLMVRVRYLSRSFVVFTQDICRYSAGIHRKAYLKTSLMEVFEGTERMPMLNHPYYLNCNKLTIVHQEYKWYSNGVSSSDNEMKFMQDLFTEMNLFPCLESLKIVVSHWQRTANNIKFRCSNYKALA